MPVTPRPESRDGGLQELSQTAHGKQQASGSVKDSLQRKTVMALDTQRPPLASVQVHGRAKPCTHVCT